MTSLPPPPATPPPKAAPSAPQPPKEAAPFHVLMSPTKERAQAIKLSDPRIQNDYLVRRYRSVSGDGASEKDLWSATTQAERALADCCELEEELGLDFDLYEDDEGEIYRGGALSRGMEFKFVELLARHCHTPVTRSLALAILQHTIEQDNLDVQEEEEINENADGDAEGSSESGNLSNAESNETPTKDGTTPTTETVQEEESVPAKAKVRSEAKEPSSQTAKPIEKPKISEETPRIHRFFEAGGLQILKEWLVEATTPIKKSTKALSSQTNAGQKKPPVPKLVRSATGPLLLPLLAVLESMPLDKRLVTETKINKYIRDLKKQLDEALRQRREETNENLDVFSDPLAGGWAVIRVVEAIESLMEKWKERAKMNNTVDTPDPYESLRDAMRKRLDILTQFEIGKAPKPEWLAAFEESERAAKEKKALSKMTTHQLEARQQRLEREKSLQAIKEKQNEVKQKMEQLLQERKEELSKKRKAEQETGPERKKKAKKVQWKDGFTDSDSLRKRKLLEQVFHYPSERSLLAEDEGKEDVEPTKDEEGDDDDDEDMFGDNEPETDQNPLVAVKEEPQTDSGPLPAEKIDQNLPVAVKEEPGFV